MSSTKTTICVLKFRTLRARAHLLGLCVVQLLELLRLALGKLLALCCGENERERQALTIGWADREPVAHAPRPSALPHLTGVVRGHAFVIKLKACIGRVIDKELLWWYASGCCALCFQPRPFRRRLALLALLLLLDLQLPATERAQAALSIACTSGNPAKQADIILPLTLTHQLLAVDEFHHRS